MYLKLQILVDRNIPQPDVGPVVDEQVVCTRV